MMLKMPETCSNGVKKKQINKRFISAHICII